MAKKKTKKEIDREVDAEFEAMTKEEAMAAFASSQPLHVPAKKRDNKLISIRLPMSMINQLRDVAMQRGDIGYQQLIKIYIADGLLRTQLGRHEVEYDKQRPVEARGQWHDLLDNSFSVHAETQLPASKVYWSGGQERGVAHPWKLTSHF